MQTTYSSWKEGVGRLQSSPWYVRFGSLATPGRDPDAGRRAPRATPWASHAVWCHGWDFHSDLPNLGCGGGGVAVFWGLELLKLDGTIMLPKPKDMSSEPRANQACCVDDRRGSG